MKLEEAIRHAEEVAIDQDLCCSECADEHRQLAEWLKDYKRLREGINNAIKEMQGYLTTEPSNKQWIDGINHAIEILKKNIGE